MSAEWDTSSILGMEQTAMKQEDNMCCVKIVHQYLEVTCTDHKRKRFTYKWGKNFVDRHVAVSVLATRTTERRK